MTEAEIRRAVLDLDALFKHWYFRPAYLCHTSDGRISFDGGHVETNWPGALEYMQEQTATIRRGR